MPVLPQPRGRNIEAGAEDRQDSIGEVEEEEDRASGSTAGILPRLYHGQL